MIKDLPDTTNFAFGDIVWMVIDGDGEDIGKGMVVGFLYKPGNMLVQVEWGINATHFHQQYALTKDEPKKFA